MVNGKPLIQYPVKAALSSKYVDEVWVLTDGRCISNATCDASADQRLKVYKRSEKSAQDTSNSEDVLLEFCEKYDRHGFGSDGFDIMVFMQCTSPLTQTEDIDKGLELLEDDSYFNSVLACCEDHGGHLCGGFTWKTDIKLPEYEGTSHEVAVRITPYTHQRQNMSKRYRENGAFYISYVEDFKKEKTRLPGNIRICEMPKARSFEIDSKEDLEEVKKILCLKS